MPKSNNFYKILSIAIAVILWIFVLNVENPPIKKTIQDVPVSLINEEALHAKGLAITGNHDYKVNVVVEGNKIDMGKLKKEQVEVEANVSGYPAGKNYVPVEVILPESLKSVETKPSKIVVNIEDLVTESKPVKVVVNGSTKGENEIGDISTRPETVEVTGAKSEVAQVQYIKAEAAASKFTRSGSKVTVEAIPVNTEGEAVSYVSLSADVVGVSAKVYSVKEVPLNVQVTGEVNNRFEVTSVKKPDKIKIRGTKEALRDIKEINAGPVDISNITANVSIPVKPVLPAGIELSDDSQNPVVSVTLKGITTRTFDYSAYEIHIDNLPETYSVVIHAEKITVKVSGKEAIMTNLSKSDFAPYIDLKDATLDTTTVPVSVRYDQQISFVETEPAEVQISLSEVQQ